MQSQYGKKKKSDYGELHEGGIRETALWPIHCALVLRILAFYVQHGTSLNQLHLGKEIRRENAFASLIPDPKKMQENTAALVQGTASV